MNLEWYIARRLIGSREHKSSISAPIIKIAIAAIALGLLMMLIALATGVGLRHKIREKVSAFNGHIQIYNYDNNLSEVSVIPVNTNGLPSKISLWPAAYRTLGGNSAMKPLFHEGLQTVSSLG